MDMIVNLVDVEIFKSKEDNLEKELFWKILL